MNKIEERILYASLFDIYGSLLTDQQQEIFKYYFNDDLSLNEIAELLNMSRQAVHLHQRNAVKMLAKFEQHLHCYEKKQTLYAFVKELENNPAWQAMKKAPENNELIAQFEQLRKEG